MAEEAAPALAVVKGSASPDEVAAITAVLALAAARAGVVAAAGAPRSRRPGRAAVGGWTDRARLVRAPLQPGPGAWRRSALPR